MERNKNVEVLRACAILYVMLYHFYIVSGKNIPNSVISSLIGMGGEIGVIMFFVISGFGIYSLLDAKKNSELTYTKFIFGRWKKLAPQYYICLFILLVLTDSAVYINPAYIMQIISHALFFHSLSPSWSGTINGVLWTMGVLMQFYILSFFIFKLQKKSICFPILLCIVSLFIKASIYHYILPNSENSNPIIYFVYGRQIYSALDNFIVGMLAAYFMNKKKINSDLISGIIFLVSVVVLLYWAYKGYKTGIYYDTFFSYIWHFISAILCSVMIYSACMIKQITNRLVIPLHWVARNNYGIYLWHLVITRKVLEFSQWAVSLNYFAFSVLIMCLSFIFGYISTKLDKVFLKK